MTQPVVAPRFSRTPGRAPTARHAGEATDAALLAWGFTVGDVEAFVEKGAVHR